MRHAFSNFLQFDKTNGKVNGSHCNVCSHTTTPSETSRSHSSFLNYNETKGPISLLWTSQNISHFILPPLERKWAQSHSSQGSHNLSRSLKKPTSNLAAIWSESVLNIRTTCDMDPPVLALGLSHCLSFYLPATSSSFCSFFLFFILSSIQTKKSSHFHHISTTTSHCCSHSCPPSLSLSLSKPKTNLVLTHLRDF